MASELRDAENDYARLPDWQWGGLIALIAEADEHDSPTPKHTSIHQLTVVLRELSTRADGLSVWLFRVASIHPDQQMMQTELLVGEEEDAPADLSWTYMTAERGQVQFYEYDDGTLLAGLRVLIPDRSGEMLTLTPYLVIVRSDHDVVMRNTDVRMIEAHVELLASAIRRAVLGACHQEYRHARDSRSIVAIRESAARSLLAYSLSRFIADRRKSITDWPSKSCAKLDNEEAESALIDLLDCQTYLYNYTNDQSYVLETKRMLESALESSAQADRGRMYIPCIDTSFEFEKAATLKLGRSIGRACSFLALFSANSEEARAYIKKAKEWAALDCGGASA